MPMPREEFRGTSGYHNFDAYSGFTLVGIGGSGKVYKVVRNGRVYAMKIPLQFVPDGDATVMPSEEIRRKFDSEADYLNDLSNRCCSAVVAMEDCGTAPFPWIVMEYASDSLRKAIDEKRAGIEDMVPILRRLETIHEAGFFHLDIKPDNILKVGMVWKFTDFGMSSPINTVSKSLSRNMFAGTYQYSAPEQISARKFGAKDHRTDIWQMGVVCYEVLTGGKPYDADDFFEIADFIREGGPDLSRIPEKYRPVLAKAFSIEKDGRYRTAAEFADALSLVMADSGKNTPEDVTELSDGELFSSSSGTVVVDLDEISKILEMSLNEDNGTASVSVFVGEPRDITIPSAVSSNGRTYAVTSIGYNAFRNCTSLESVYIPKSVTSIKEGAFADCTSLESVTIPKYLKSIDAEAFADCSSLESVTIPNSVTEISPGAFSGCTSLTEIVVGKGNAQYTSLDGILFTRDMDVIHTFPAGNGLTEYCIPNSVKYIGDFAFDMCSFLKLVIIPGSVESIGENAFSFCKSLESIEIPDSVTYIEKYAFNQCSSLKSAPIPKSVKSISEGLFDGCGLLESISIPKSVKSISEGAFDYCSSLKSVDIPDSVTEIGPGAFRGCTSLTEIVVGKGNAKYTSLDGILFTRDMDVIHTFPAGNGLTEYCIPNSVISIEDFAFIHCLSLKSVRLTDPVAFIGKYAFAFCKSLESVAIPDSVTSIRRGAFINCPSLKSVNIPDSLISIEWGAFFKCPSLISAIVPASLNVNNIFGTSVNITRRPAETPAIVTEAVGLEEISRILEIILEESGSTASVKTFVGEPTRIVIPSAVSDNGRVYPVKSIGPYSFNGCSSLESLTIPDSVTSIGSSPFADCDSLSEIKVGEGNTRYTVSDGVLFDKSMSVLIRCPPADGRTEYRIPDSVTEIEEHAFRGCVSLESVEIPDSVTSIEEGTFEGCRSLKAVKIPDSVASIGDFAFYGCSSLESVTIPDSVTSIGLDAFRLCSSMTSASVPAPLVIGDAFGNYTKIIRRFAEIYADMGAEPVYLEEISNKLEISLDEDSMTASVDGFVGEPRDIVIPSAISSGGHTYTVMFITKSAFKNCGSLESVTMPDSVTSIGECAFLDCRSLRSVTIPDSVTSIGEGAFNHCPSLKSISVPASLNVDNVFDSEVIIRRRKKSSFSGILKRRYD